MRVRSPSRKRRTGPAIEEVEEPKEVPTGAGGGEEAALEELFAPLVEEEGIAEELAEELVERGAPKRPTRTSWKSALRGPRKNSLRGPKKNSLEEQYNP